MFFRAAGIRYVVDAGGVLEVARPGPDEETLRGHLGLRDFGQLLGGVTPLLDKAALVFDTSPTLAARVDDVDGIFDASSAQILEWTTLAAEHFSGIFKQGLLYEGQLWFELSLTGMLERPARPVRPLTVAAMATTEPCLHFESGGQLFALPLSTVRHVVSRGPTFNPQAPTGALRGALAFNGLLLPVYSVSGSDRAEAFLIAVEAGEHRAALSAEIVHGVKAPAGQSVVIDLPHTFS